MTTKSVGWLGVGAFGCLAAAIACSDNGSVTTVGVTPPADAGPGAVPPGGGVGATCGASDPCREGLKCASGACATCGCSSAGTLCTVSDECTSGDYCGPTRACTTAGTGMADASCSSDADCAPGLRCNLVGLSAECQPEGTKDVGGACTLPGDCLAGLTCASGSCAPLPPVGDGGMPPLVLPTSLWPGVTCTDVTGPTQAYFRVPRGTSDDGDFYRLPYPNDVRFVNGHVSLTNPNHPTPGSALLGYDVVQRWLDSLQANVDGFSTYGTVFFRFSAAVDLGGTFKNSDVVRYVDITNPTSPVDQGFGWYGQTGANHYICDNWIAVRPPTGSPLTQGHTYTVLVTTAGLDSTGHAIQVSPDLTALLQTSAPTSDTALMAAWPAYQPLRDWIATSPAGISAANILTATVFTVGHPAAIGPKLAAAVAAATAPTATQWVNCDTGGTSPCPQATGDRACPSTPDPAFTELHAMVSLPIFQQGTEPYSNPPDGDLMLGSDGTPQLQRTEQVCMCLTVPKGAPMPAGGWPLVVYAHGTGGYFRSHAQAGTPPSVGHRLASVDDGNGGQVQMAVLGIDQVETGPRRGASTDSPDNLFYNFANPGAARGNTLQGAADQLSLFEFASALDLSAANSPTMSEIKFGSIVFWGHSQGASEGGVALPYATGVLGAVLSGEGASLIDALLTKQNPVDVAADVPVVLEDPGNVSINHPVLSLLQNDLDLVDPLNHANALVVNPIATANQKHIFQPYGQLDTYAPPATQQIFAIAAQLGEAAPQSGVTDDVFGNLTPMPVPVGGNQMIMGTPITAILRQYVSDGTYDPHFVAFDNMQAETDVDHFLADAVSGKTPQVGR